MVPAQIGELLLAVAVGDAFTVTVVLEVAVHPLFTVTVYVPVIAVVELAMEGFLVLGERARNIMDKQFIKETIERVTKVKIDERNYYEEYF